MRSVMNSVFSRIFFIALYSLVVVTADSQAESNQGASDVDPAIKKELLSLVLESSYECKGSDSRFWTVLAGSISGPTVRLYEVKSLDFEITETPTVSTADKLNGLEMKLVVEFSPEIAWRDRNMGLLRNRSRQMNPGPWSKWYSEVSHFGTVYPHLFHKENGEWIYDGMRAAFDQPKWGLLLSLSEERVFDQQLCPGDKVATSSQALPPKAKNSGPETESTSENVSLKRDGPLLCESRKSFDNAKCWRVTTPNMSFGQYSRFLAKKACMSRMEFIEVNGWGPYLDDIIDTNTTYLYQTRCQE